MLDGCDGVSVTSARCRYAPTDYPTGGEWAARVVIESSRAIKCPSIGYHIMTLKKIQQVRRPLAYVWRPWHVLMATADCDTTIPSRNSLCPAL